MALCAERERSEPYPDYILDVPRCRMQSDSRQSGIKDDIEITPEMIEAGLVALSDFTEIDGTLSGVSMPSAVAAILRSAHQSRLSAGLESGTRGRIVSGFD